MPKPSIKKEVYYKKENPKTHERKKASTVASRARTVEQERQKHEDRLEERRRRPKHVYTEAKVLEMDGHPYQEPEFQDVDDDIIGDYDDEIHSKILLPPSPIHDDDETDDTILGLGGFNGSALERDDSSSSDEEDLKGKTGSRTQTLVAAAPSDPDDPDDGGSKTMLVDDKSNADLKGKQQMTQYTANLRYYEGEEKKALVEVMDMVYSPVHQQVEAFKAMDPNLLRDMINVARNDPSVPKVKIEELDDQYNQFVGNRNYVVHEDDELVAEGKALIARPIDPAAASRGEMTVYQGDVQKDRTTLMDWLRPRALKVAMAASEGMKAGYSLFAAIGAVIGAQYGVAINKGLEFGSHMSNLIKIVGTNLENTENLRKEIYGLSQNTQSLIQQSGEQAKNYAEVTNRMRALESNIAVNQQTITLANKQRETLAIEWRNNQDAANNNMQLINTNVIKTQEQLKHNTDSLTTIMKTLQEVNPIFKNTANLVSLVNKVDRGIDTVNKIANQVIQTMPTGVQQENFYNQISTYVDEATKMYGQIKEQYGQLVKRGEESTNTMANTMVQTASRLENQLREYGNKFPEYNKQLVLHINQTNENMRKAIVDDISLRVRDLVTSEGKLNNNLPVTTVVYKTDETVLQRYMDLVSRKLDGLQTTFLGKKEDQQLVIPAPQVIVDPSLATNVAELRDMMKKSDNFNDSLLLYLQTRHQAIQVQQEMTNRLLREIEDTIALMIKDNHRYDDEWCRLFKWIKERWYDVKNEPIRKEIPAIAPAYNLADPGGALNPDNMRRLLGLLEKVANKPIFDLPYSIIAGGLNLPPHITDEELYRRLDSLRKQGSKMSTRTHGRVYIGGKHIDPFIQPDYNEKREKEIRRNRITKIEKRQKKDEADMYGGFFKLL